MRTVLVTGGTVRIGRAIAERLRADGWRVLTSSHRADAGADFNADLATPGGADALFDRVTDALGGSAPDALVNNAALFTDPDDRLDQVNFKSPRRLMERMSQGGASVMRSVVNILDSKLLTGPASSDTPYLATKRRLLDATLRGAREYAPRMRVNAIAPGPVLPPVDVHEKAGKILLNRRPTPEDIATAVAFLLTAESVTGVTLPIDAGQHLSDLST